MRAEMKINMPVGPKKARKLWLALQARYKLITTYASYIDRENDDVLTDTFRGRLHVRRERLTRFALEKNRGPSRRPWADIWRELAQ